MALTGTLAELLLPLIRSRLILQWALTVRLKENLGIKTRKVKSEQATKA